MTSNDIPASSRRTVLCGATALASAAAAGFTVTGCDNTDTGPQQLSEPVDLGPADEVPVGGAKLYRDEKVLVCQPEAGEYRAFSAICTHEGCVLSGLRDDGAVCSCHGSVFDPETGDVLQGPALEPLPALELDTSDGSMTARPA